MKKVTQIAIATLVTALVSTTAMAQISAQKASTVASKHVGGGTVTDIDYKGSYYEIDVRKANGQKHEVKVNANNGKVIFSKLDGHDRYATRPMVQQPAVQQVAQNRVSGAITAQQASDIAAKHVGGQVLDVDFERKAHGDFYDVEVVNEQGIKYDVRVNANNGNIEYSRIDD